MAYLVGVVAALVVIVLVAWAGVKVQPRSFPPYVQRTPELRSIALPAGLPAPVERFYRTLYGEQIPVIASAVATGRAMMRPAGPVQFPARFRFTFEAGQAYRHYIEMTWFGMPIIKANEHYVDGKGRMQITLIGTDAGDKYDQAANLGLWFECSLFPSVYLTDPRVRWLPVDDVTAILVVPFRQEQEHIVVRFDPQSHAIRWMEAMRYHSSTSTQKTLWLSHALPEERRGDKVIPARGEVIWMDDGKPWFVMTTEDIVFNVDVGEYICATGL